MPATRPSEAVCASVSPGRGVPSNRRRKPIGSPPGDTSLWWAMKRRRSRSKVSVLSPIRPSRARSGTIVRSGPSSRMSSTSRTHRQLLARQAVGHVARFGAPPAPQADDRRRESHDVGRQTGEMLQQQPGVGEPAWRAAARPRRRGRGPGVGRRRRPERAPPAERAMPSYPCPAFVDGWPKRRASLCGGWFQFDFRGRGRPDRREGRRSGVSMASISAKGFVAFV